MQNPKETEEESETRLLLEKVLTLKKSVEILAKQKNNHIKLLENEMNVLTKQFNKQLESMYNKEKRDAASYLILHQKYLEEQRMNKEKDNQIQKLQEQLEMKNPETLQHRVILDQKEEINQLKLHLSEAKKMIGQKEEQLKLALAKLELSDKHINRLKKEYFFSLNVGMKLTLVFNGYECNVPTSSLWEACQQEKVDYTQWRSWIEKKMNSIATKSEKPTMKLTRSSSSGSHTSTSPSLASLSNPIISPSSSNSNIQNSSISNIQNSTTTNNQNSTISNNQNSTTSKSNPSIQNNSKGNIPLKNSK